VIYRLSKLLAHLACLSPLAWLVYAAFNRLLGADAQEKMLHELGLWTLIFLLLSLSVTPTRQLLGFSVLIKFRRM
jgi:sulfoxide reductase heme-binding subunit YedZ